VLDQTPDTCTPRGAVAQPCPSATAIDATLPANVADVLADGDLQLDATATDLAGNRSAVRSWTVHLDRTRPAARAEGDLGVLQDAWTNRAAPIDLTVSGRDAGSGVQRLQLVAVDADGRSVLAQADTCAPADRDPLDGACPHRVTRTLALDPAKLPDGKVTFEVQAVDLAGHVSDSGQDWDTYVDHTPPPAPTGLVVTATATDAASISWNRVTDAPSGSGGVTYQYLIQANGQTVVNWTSTPYAQAIVPGLPPGANVKAFVRAIDAAENYSEDASDDGWLFGTPRLVGPRGGGYDANDCQFGRSPCGTFDAGRAVKYALKWTAGYNPAYKVFADDCTNFLSQIMRAGGMQMMREFHLGQGSWWSQTYGRNTLSWSVADTFVHHLIDYRLAVYVTNGRFEPGDVLAFAWRHRSDDPSLDVPIDHVNFVASVDATGQPLLVQHTPNYSRPLSYAAFLGRVKRESNAPFRLYHLRPVHTKANIG
jgi:hypothetical protein